MLVQPHKNKASRTYMDYETEASAMDGKLICTQVHFFLLSVPYARSDLQGLRCHMYMREESLR